MSKRPARPPKHLKTAGRAWWRAVVSTFELESHELATLTLAAEALDRCTAARATLDSEGTTYLDRFDAPRSRPEVAIERDSRLAFARLVRELDLHEQADARRPPALPSSRWGAARVR